MKGYKQSSNENEETVLHKNLQICEAEEQLHKNIEPVLPWNLDEIEKSPEN